MKMIINKLNYEVYALDYLEGTLTEDLMPIMQAFLKQHPEIALELESTQSTTLKPDEKVVFLDKTVLKKVFSFV